MLTFSLRWNWSSYIIVSFEEQFMEEKTHIILFPTDTPFEAH